MSTQGQGQSTKTDGQTTGTRVRVMTSQRKGGVRLDLSYCWERQREKDGESEREKRGSWCLFTHRAIAFFLDSDRLTLTPADDSHRLVGRLWRTAMSSDLVHASADTAASINTLAKTKTLLAWSIFSPDLSTVWR